MNIFKLLATLAEVDPEAYQRQSARRGMLSRLGQVGRKVAATAVPLGLGALPQQAHAGTQTILDTFTLALTLEQLEQEFYATALERGRQGTLVFPAGTQAVIQQIQGHEQSHVTFFQRQLQRSGAAVPAKPNFDFTGSKNGTKPALFPDVFTSFATFLKVAQLLEDTGVRAYKGQVEVLVADNDVLEAVLQIHAVEARHAAHIRGMRRALGATVRDWVSSEDDIITTAGSTDAVYGGEDATRQMLPGTPVKFFPADTTPVAPGPKPLVRLGEAFDEPITATVAANLAGLFIY
ncbi:Ferritin-like domain-containing protein [Hymenobacter daecheongensis DSM 21074]|uniref:Ferritin-like domain-containing protein n=1 Tax=Hymenobacter daecheongensis DSM 21074 TaxID=1121955 RepID=A0A1M6CZW0_9BACT|nr:ferritin-like domain-containing protein [Hymenobacter daecheongensis]SHI66268.1 Ferritin-like domain-containing protein [Hymenobacter daecheongensis DSM 21074]